MSVEVCAFQQQQQQQQQQPQQLVKSTEPGSKQSPKHYALLEGKNDKVLQMEGMGIHTRHASVPDSLLLKGSAMNAAENGWSPAHERFTGMASGKPDLKHPVVKQLKKQNANTRQQQMMSINHNAASNGSRTTDEESVDYDSSLENTSVSSFDFNRERAAAAAANANAAGGGGTGGGTGGRSVIGALHPKPAPSKWDDAEKWLVSADAAALRGNKPKMQQLLSSIPAHVIINASKKAALLGQGRGNKLGSGMDVDAAGGEVDLPCTKKIDTAGGPYKFSFMPSPGMHPKTRSMSSLDRYPLEELLTCDQPGKLKLVSVSSDPENMDDDMSKPALRTEKPTSDFPDGQMMEHGSGKALDGGRSPAASRETASYVTPPGLRSVSMRDMGTEMTPIASQEPSRTGTPLRATTPTIRSPVSSRPSTPGRGLPPASSTKTNGNTDVDSTECTNSAAQTPGPQLELSEKQMQAKTRQEILALGTQLGKANIAAWASREEEEADASKCLKNIDLEEVKRNVLEARASAWEEAEKAKYEARYKREESKIIAWENHEKAKAEAEMRRIEVKVERMRSHSHEELMNKLAVSHRRAEELRAAAEARRVEQAARTAQRAEYIRQTGNIPPAASSPLSIFLQLGRLCCR